MYRYDSKCICLAIQSDLFGTVKWPFWGIKWPPTRGWKGHFESPGVYTFWVFVSTSFGLWNWLHNKLWRFCSGGTQQVEQRVLLGPPIHIAGQFIATTSDINQKVVYKSRRSHWKWLIKADFEIKIISKLYKTDNFPDVASIRRLVT